MIELENLAVSYHPQNGTGRRAYDVPKYYRKWSHPAEAIELKDKCDNMNYMMKSVRTVVQVRKG
jgi:hypothetical protein